MSNNYHLHKSLQKKSQANYFKKPSSDSLTNNGSSDGYNTSSRYSNNAGLISSILTPQHLPATAPPVPPVSLPRPFKHLIFSYGTLKRNMRNHYRMRKPGIAFAFNAKTVDRFPLFLDPENRYRPSLLNARGVGYQVLGEAYAVNDQELRFMDQFERVPEHYHRQLYPISPIFDSHFDKNIASYLFSNSSNEKIDLSPNSTSSDYILLAHIYCQNVDTPMKHKFIEHLSLKQPPLEGDSPGTLSFSSTEPSSNINLPSAIQCYGSDEDKLYTPRVLNPSKDSSNEEGTPSSLQHLSHFFT